MKPSTKLPFHIPFKQEKIVCELASIPEDTWIPHVNDSYYQGSWSVIPLRTTKVNEKAHPILQSFQIEAGEEWVDLPIQEQLPNISKLVSLIKADLLSVRLMRLDPLSEIKAHRDLGLAYEYGEVRLHIPLQSSAGVNFFSDGRRLSMNSGELWYINADQVHSVENKSVSSRINLVIDCKVGDWISSLFGIKTQ